jgi:hypothetical protein
LRNGGQGGNNRIKGIDRADVTIGNASIKYDESNVKREEIEAAIEKTGFKVSGGIT